jgi:ATP-dependent Lhr-like helicase
VLEAQLEFSRVSDSLARLSGRRILITRPRRFTPLGFPLWASRLQTQMVSTESWQQRIERAARDLEVQAVRELEEKDSRPARSARRDLHT